MDAALSGAFAARVLDRRAATWFCRQRSWSPRGSKVRTRRSARRPGGRLCCRKIGAGTAPPRRALRARLGEHTSVIRLARRELRRDLARIAVCDRCEWSRTTTATGGGCSSRPQRWARPALSRRSCPCQGSLRAAPRPRAASRRPAGHELACDPTAASTEGAGRSGAALVLEPRDTARCSSRTSPADGRSVICGRARRFRCGQRLHANSACGEAGPSCHQIVMAGSGLVGTLHANPDFVPPRSITNPVASTVSLSAVLESPIIL